MQVHNCIFTYIPFVRLNNRGKVSKTNGNFFAGNLAVIKISSLVKSDFLEKPDNLFADYRAFSFALPK